MNRYHFCQKLFGANMGTNIINNSFMSIDNYNLSGLEDAFKKIQTDKKQPKTTQLEIVLQMNKTTSIDELVIRLALETYPNRQQLKDSNLYAAYEAFFRYVVANMDSIEEKYLSESQDQELITKAEKQNYSEYLFLLNKNSVSKFIKDESAHYQAVLEKYLEASSQGERVIKSRKMHFFFVELFKNKHIKIIKDHAVYLQQNEADISVDIGKKLSNYGQEAKDLTAEKAQNQFQISQEEILDFLTFWLKKEEEHQLFVLYARTNARLQKETKILLNKSVVEVKGHPSRMTSQQINELEKQQLEASVIMEKSATILMQQLTNQHMNALKPQPQRFSSVRSFNPQLSFLGSSVDETSATKEKKEPTKQQMLRKQLRNLFNYGCKRRYKLHKNSTFEELQYELTYMDLQKFINFCLFFEIPSVISKDIITEYFRMNAINRQRIDFQRFQKIIEQLVRTDQRVIDHLLSRTQFQVKKNKRQIEHNQKSDGGVSKYQFKLRPVNGKDISSIKKELQYKKLEKQIEREEKDHQALAKREKVEQSRLNVRSISNLQNSRTTNCQRQPTEELKLNLDFLIGQEKEKDRLWDVYEAKIWKRDEKASNSILESALSKRMKKGKSIINKINSQRSLLYE